MTPKSYLSFINGYKTVYSLKRNQIGDLGARMNTGLDKLMEASESVAELSKQLAVKEKELAVASQKADTVRVKPYAQTRTHCLGNIKKNICFFICLILDPLERIEP